MGFPRSRQTFVLANAFQSGTVAAGQRYRLSLENLPTRGPRGGMYVLDRLRIKTQTVAQTIPAGKSLDAYSLGQILLIGLTLSGNSPFVRGECGREIIPEGTWMADLMRAWSLVMATKIVRGSNGRLRAPQISGADVTTPLDVYCAVKEQDDRAAFPQHTATFGDDGGGGGAAFSARVEFTISFSRRSEPNKRNIPTAHFNGDLGGKESGKSAGYLTLGTPASLAMDNTAFTLGTEGWEVLADLIELDPSEVVVPVIPRLIVDQYNDKNFSLSKPSLPKDLIIECPEPSSGAQSVTNLTTCYVEQNGVNLADPNGDMSRLPNAIADQLENLDERWAYPASQAALTSTCNTNRYNRDVHILATAVDRGMVDLIPPGRININVQSGTIPTGGFRILQMAWDPGDTSVQRDATERLGGDVKTLEPGTANGNKADASKGVNLPKVAKQVLATAFAAKE